MQVHPAGSWPAEDRQPGEPLPASRWRYHTRHRLHLHPGLWKDHHAPSGLGHPQSGKWFPHSQEYTGESRGCRSHCLLCKLHQRHCKHRPDWGQFFPILLWTQLPSENLNREEKKNKFVYLKVVYEGFYTEERAMMVSFQSGYIFIQTDKPIYNPGDTGEEDESRAHRWKHKILVPRSLMEFWMCACLCSSVESLCLFTVL